MSRSERYKAAKELLGRYGQGHLLDLYDRLGDDEQDGLLDAVDRLDFSRIPGWVQDYVTNSKPAALPEEFGPADYYPATSPDSEQMRAKYDQARKLGAELLAGGKVAAFVVAGGQGTRLGFDGPKGNFPISPVRNKTLFQIFGETILAAGRKYGADLPWYVMTSPLNYVATVEIFKSNDYYGLDESNVFIFQQGTLPNFAFDGKILMASAGTIAASPDGHGGSLKALYDSGATADMKSRGIEYISYFQVDNPLVSVVDELFIGLSAMDEAEMSSRALIKAHSKEKVGNFCLVDGRVTVIEYSDLPDEQAEKRSPDGSLVFELGSIAIHVISRAFVEKLNADGFALPIHRAVKKIAHVDADGTAVKPEEPNGVKLETFVFDALPLADKSIILQTIRSEEFAPVKNATGDDSPEVTRRMMVDRSAAWLKAAGIEVPTKADGSPDCVIEIAPGFAICAGDVKAKADQIAPIKSGETVYLE